MMFRLPTAKVIATCCGLFLLLTLGTGLADLDWQPWLEDFYLTLPGQSSADADLKALPTPAPEAGAPTPGGSDTAPLSAPPQPLSLLRPSLEYHGLDLWGWVAAAAIFALGVILALTQMLRQRYWAAGSVRYRQQRQAHAAIADLLTQGDEDALALSWLAVWYDLPENCNGTEMARALRDNDPETAAAVTQWEQERFAKTEAGAVKPQASHLAWQAFLRKWLRRHQWWHKWRRWSLVPVLAGTQIPSPAEQALIWNRTVRLPQELAAVSPNYWPAWFTPEVALVTLATALAVGMVAWSTAGKLPRFRRHGLPVMLAMLVIVSSARLLITHRNQQKLLANAAIVLQSDYLRPAPESNLILETVVATGDLVIIKDTNGDWRQVQCQQKKLGWLHQTTITTKKPWLVQDF